MTTKVKICGLKTETALEVALDGGADYVGLVFFPPSPRYVSLAQAAAMAAKARNRAKVVALLVDPDEALIADVLAAATPDLLQLHGQETPERVAEIRTRWGVPVMKAVAVERAARARRIPNLSGGSCSARRTPNIALPGAMATPACRCDRRWRWSARGRARRRWSKHRPARFRPPPRRSCVRARQ